MKQEWAMFNLWEIIVKAKFAFVGTNNEGYITTFHTESGKTFWKLLNGENIPVINPK